MLTRRTLGTLAILLSLGSYALTQAPEVKDGQRLAALIKQLGSAKSSEREKATKELEAIGAPALDLLRKAAKEADLETSRRADSLVKKLEEKITTTNLLAPKRVRLNVTDMPVLDAVNELAKISGYPIQVQGDRTVLADKKVTLDTGDTTFWEALDQLCGKAGLIENTTPSGGPMLPGRPPIRIRPPRVAPLPAPAIPLPLPAPQPDLPAQPVPIAAPAEFVAAIDVEDAPVPVPPAQGGAGKAQAQPAVQAAPVQVQILPAQGFDVVPGRFGRPMSPSGAVILVPSKTKQALTSYAGAVRVRVLPGPGANQPREQGQHHLMLDAAAEPRLQGFRIVGTPTIEKAIDDQGQSLASAMPPMNPNGANDMIIGGGNIIINGGMVIDGFQGMPGMSGQRQATVRLKAGEKQAKTLKELKGHLTAEVIVPNETLLSLDNVLKAAGETVKGKSGGAITVNSIEKTAKGEYKLKIKLENPPDGNPFGGAFNGVIQFQQVQIQIAGGGGVVMGGFGPGGNGGLPELVDAKGNKYQLVNIPSRSVNANNGQVTQELVMVFSANNNQGDPARLVLFGNRTTTIQIPFAFQNVPLQ